MIVNGVNEMAQYNHTTEKHESPTLAINFVTLLKKCCDLAFIQLLQIHDTGEQREGLKILKNLIVYTMGRRSFRSGGSNLNESKWNKEELLPLTSDLKKLSDYLSKASGQQYNELKEDSDVDAYYELKDILHVQILLLNRRRPAEVAQLKSQTFRAIYFNSSKQDTEFQSCLTETDFFY
ncbi:hypothetical protein JTB14_037798 [Gonioctena quinquepunctata]|nr:hypothetical protein JTB14_037798 [Gonioctena quinquepunctata]